MTAEGRRIVPDTPRLVGRQWHEIAQELQEFLRSSRDSEDEGIPAGYSSDTPLEGAAGGVGDAGEESAGWTGADHTHPHTVGTPVDIALANAVGGGANFADAEHVHASKLTTNGDLLTVIAGVLARLAVGAAGKILAVSSGLPAWEAAGTQPYPITEKSGDYTLTDADYTCLVDATGGNRTITLPAAAGASGRIYVMKKIDASANKAILDGDGAETVDGAATMELLLQHESVMVQSDGTEWWIL